MKRSAQTGERGLALAELAICIPFLMLLLIGIVELGRYMYFSILVANAAHAGAQYGSQDTQKALDLSGMQTAALNDGQNVSGLVVSSPAPKNICNCWNGTTSTAVNCATPSPCATSSPASQEQIYVQVTAKGTLSPLLRWPGLPTTFTVTRVATMRVSP